MTVCELIDSGLVVWESMHCDLGVYWQRVEQRGDCDSTCLEILGKVSICESRIREFERGMEAFHFEVVGCGLIRWVLNCLDNS